jgi:hypothetical protein
MLKKPPYAATRQTPFLQGQRYKPKDFSYREIKASPVLIILLLHPKLSRELTVYSLFYPILYISNGSTG